MTVSSSVLIKFLFQVLLTIPAISAEYEDVIQLGVVDFEALKTGANITIGT
jgi:hypothetical protein